MSATPTSDLIARVLTAWTRLVRRRAAWVIAAFAALTAASLWCAITRLSIETDTGAMLSPDLPWRKIEQDYARAFPQQRDLIAAVIDGAAPEAADSAQEALSRALTDKGFARVAAPGREEFFRRNAFLFLDLPRLEQLASDLETAQPFLGRLTADPSLAGLFELLNLALTETTHTIPFDLAQVLTPISASVGASTEGRLAPLSWQGLLARSLPAGGQRFVLIQPQADADERAALDQVRAAAQRVASDHGARVRLTGDIPLWVDELAAAADGAVLSALAAFLLGAGFLYWGLRSLRLVGIALLTLVCGLIITAGFAALAVGRLNLISVAFSTLYIGIAIDYGVQLCMRYRELLGQGQPHAQALDETGGGFGAALVLCALTTVAGFYAFVPTDYRGVAELGMIAGTGIFIGLFTSLTLLPALIECWPLSSAQRLPQTRVPAALAQAAGLPLRRPVAVRTAALALALIGVAALPQLRFDANPTHLKPAGIESLQAYEDLLRGEHSPMTVSALAPDAAAATALAKKFDALPAVGRVLWLDRFVPAQQKEKLAVIDSLSLSLGLTLPASLALAPADAARDLASLRKARDAAQRHGNPISTELARRLDAWLTRYGTLPAADQAARLTQLRDALLRGMPRLLAQLQQALQAQPFAAADIPEEIRRDWVGTDGRYRVEAGPRENLDNDDALQRFVEQIQGVTDQASGAPIGYVEGARVVIRAFVQAFAGAFCMIVLILFLLLRELGDTLRALVPLVLGAVLLGAIGTAAGMSLNFANVIALPLLLGIGVDIGVLILWRARRAATPDENPVLTGTGAAVLISVLATLASFASLMLSAHRGMASIGGLLSLGLVIYLACTFLVLPALLPRARAVAGPPAQLP